MEVRWPSEKEVLPKLDKIEKILPQKLESTLYTFA